MNCSRKPRTLRKLLPALVRVWAYLRVSTTKQVRKDTREYGSLDKQSSAINFFVERRKHEGWKLERTVSDPAESGDDFDRPGLQDILVAARKGELDILVIFNYDRLSREWNHAKAILTELEACGVIVWVVTANAIVALHPIEEYRRAYYAFGDAEIDLQKIRKQRRNDALQMTLGGYWQASQAPLGYKARKLIKSRILVEDRRESKTIVELLKRLPTEEIGDVLANFAQRGIRTRPHRVKRKGRWKEIGRRPFTWDLVLKIVNNPIYAGFTFIRNYDAKKHAGKQPFDILPDGTALFVAKHKGLVSLECWRKAWDAVYWRKRRVRKPRTLDLEGKFLLQGLIWCSHCGRRMTNKGKGGGIGSYRCMSVVENASTQPCKCPVNSVPAGVIEDATATLMQRVVQRPEIVDAISRHSGSTSCGPGKKAICQLNRTLKSLNNTRAKLLTAIQAATGKGTILTLTAELDVVTARRDQIQRQIDVSWQDTPKVLRSATGIRLLMERLAEASTTLNRSRLKEVYRTLLYRVSVSAGRSNDERRNLRVKLEVRPNPAAHASDETIPLQLEIEVASRRARNYSITRPFKETRRLVVGPACDNEKGPQHCLERLEKYQEMARTMKQREIAAKVGSTPANVCQVLRLEKIPLVLRRRILAASGAAKEILGLNRLMALSKLPGPVQEARVTEALAGLRN